MSMNERGIIKRANEKYKLDARRLEKVIERNYGIRIPHNRIHHHHHLKERLAKEESTKKKRRKPYIKYEREHTLSAWHIDWYTGFNNTMFFDCYNRYRGDFECMNAFIEWYNTVRPRCLGTKWHLQTSEVAFGCRLPMEARVGMAAKLFGW